MATVRPFRALRPRPADAARVAAVPYDVVSTDEARTLAEGNPLSFLRVSRPELELPGGTDPHADIVYERAAANFSALKTRALILDAQPNLYLYRLVMGDHEQMGLAGCYSLDEYDRDVVKKHERTRRDKEDDRTRHMLALGAQTGPVFLTYRAHSVIDANAVKTSQTEPLFDFVAEDGVRHTMWLVDRADGAAVVKALAEVPALYIADGHHRAASAARARHEARDRAVDPLADGAGISTFLAVAFPHDQVQILPYNRVVKDLGALSPDAFLDAVRERFDVSSGPATPLRRGDIAMYFGGRWHTLRPRAHAARDGENRSLDVTVLQDLLLAPILGIADVRTDARIDFVGGARGTAELERLVTSGAAAVAFSLYPVSVDDLMAVSDAGGIMPPKSTWFEPKLRDGLLIHVI